MNAAADPRPDPDRLLAELQRDDRQARRGRLRVYFGAAAGVGKTCAMLSAAQAAMREGRALQVGIVETHGRADTEALARGLPRLPRRAGASGSTPPAVDDARAAQGPLDASATQAAVDAPAAYAAFDLDAALAWAAGQTSPLVLLDELACQNPPGARHPKRWQDVEELRDAGIEVWTTLNVQHLESLNDVVGGITGVRVRETVPDRVFDDADEVIVIDLPPDELLARLKAGKVYRPGDDDAPATRAAAHFFRKGNLLALRELALRRTADRVDDEAQAWRRRDRVQAPVRAQRDALLAAVGPGPHGEKVVRSAARLAARLDVPWHAVHVETPQHPREGAAHAAHDAAVTRVLRLAENLGATVASPAAPDAAGALVRYAREHDLSRLVVGRRERRWRPPWRRSLADRIAAGAEELDVLQVALPAQAALREVRPAAERPGAAGGDGATDWRGYAVALACCAATALVATPLVGTLELTNIVMLFLLAVVGVALGWGRGPAVLAAFVGVAMFDFGFVPPRYSFAVSDVQYLLTFAVMLVVALVVGQLTAGLKQQARAATARERRVRSVYEMARDLSAALMPEQVAEIGARFVAAEFGARSALLAMDAQDRLQPLPGGTATVDPGVVQWAWDHGEPAGHGTDTLPASRSLVLPLKAPMRARGVLVIEPPGAQPLGPDARRLLDTCASLLAISLERLHYVDVAQHSTVQIERERLRNSLLSAISHDLRTPLAALVGLADTLALAGTPLPPAQQEIAGAIRGSALRMNAMVDNVLDMARLEAGATQLRRVWLPLEEVVGSALAALGPALGTRPVQVQLAEPLPLLQLDAVLMERVLVNLIENALKYTPASSEIRIAAVHEDAPGGAHDRAPNGGDHVRLTVDDDGPGLPPGREARLFDKFERGQRESATPGVGLGLAIAQAVVQAHGGTIEARNRIENGQVRGARFELRLPVGQPPTDLGAVASAP